ncbi:MAG: selenide, water dikinase SelD [Verrucomicrobiae bacterium]|nr:selenide, water dikinase SelD [Verrucomicrobiae bacterium]
MDSASASIPAAKNLVLVGGGHSHALALRMLAMEPLAGVQITVVSDVAHAPYSGMLPGFIAGYYTYDEAHIDVRRLCQFAGAHFVQAECVGVDVSSKKVLLKGRSALAFDAVSINTGSTPRMDNVPGADTFAIGSKPVPALLQKWNSIIARAKSGSRQSIAIVGGGAGGVEIALCMKRRLGDQGDVTLVHRAPEILETHNPKVRHLFSQLLEERGITVHTGEGVIEVRNGQLLCNSGRTVEADHLLWVTSASPAEWIANSGLKTDTNGFLLVSPTLQSVSHPFVFGAGDAATIEGKPRPKSGVFAVRMAKPLLDNLRHFFNGEPLRAYRPQKEFLSLIGTANGEAVASRKFLAWRSSLMWQLKDRIDRKFMRKFEDLPLMPGMAEAPEPASGARTDSLADEVSELRRRSQMRCLGCAAKVGSSILTGALDRLRSERSDSPALALLDHAEDAAVFAVPGGMEMVQTVDYLPALVDDPLLFGRIATLHCFSDIFAMGALPHSALATALVPFASDTVAGETLFQLLSGVVDVLEETGAALYGGHTAEGNVLALGLTCNGFAAPGSTMEKSTPACGHSIILTKAIGTGTLFAASMRLKARGRWIDSAIASMSLSNLTASRILREYHASACTDVTGFGLAGHLLEMLRPLRRIARLDIEAIPLLAGAVDTSSGGILSSLHRQNSRAMHGLETPEAISRHAAYPLLFDPQTSGGLLAMVPREKSSDCVAALIAAGYPETTVIGSIDDAAPAAENAALIRF